MIYYILTFIAGTIFGATTFGFSIINKTKAVPLPELPVKKTRKPRTTKPRLNPDAAMTGQTDIENATGKPPVVPAA